MKESHGHYIGMPVLSGESMDLTSDKTNKRAEEPSKALEVRPRQLWEPLPEEEQEILFRGPNAILHSDGTKGRRSAVFPHLNITATAKQLGVTKSHLAKVLAGVNRPSIELAIRLAEVLGTDINVVVGLYKSRPEPKLANHYKCSPTRGK